MAQSNALNPTFDGIVKGRAFISHGSVTSVKTVRLNGTTEVNVFGASTNGFDGFFEMARMTTQDITAGTVTLWNGHPVVTRGSVCDIAKSTTAGAMVGSAFSATAFSSSGSATVVSSSATDDGIVEVFFTPWRAH